MKGSVLNYASAPVGPTPRYSYAVVVAFILALLLVLLALPMGIVLPAWAMLSVALLVFAANFAAAVHLLNAPYHVLGDGLVSLGTFISGFVTLVAMFHALMLRL